MRITIKFFGSVKKLAECEEMHLEMDKGLTVNQVLELVNEEYPAIMALGVAVTVNQRQVSDDLLLKDGDILSLLPEPKGT